MLRWLVGYIDENETQWETDNDLRSRETTGELKKQVKVANMDEAEEEKIPRVAQLSPEDADEETTDLNTSKLREKIMEETEKLRGCVIGSRSMSKLMCKFESRLEAAVSRMARLGTVEELDEPEI